jgi:hypothetical protein
MTLFVNVLLLHYAANEFRRNLILMIENIYAIMKQTLIKVFIC